MRGKRYGDNMDVNYKDQSGMSIPLTDIVEFGDNYIRFSNGTQITWSVSDVNAIWCHDTTFNTTTFTASMPVHYVNKDNVGEDSLASFKDGPNFVIPYLYAIDYGIDSLIGTSVHISSISDESVSVIIFSTNENIIHNMLSVQSSFRIYLLAIGKWK